mmetsp:Transcript_6776/g.14977  ORF Transcript_6776/g.14977 Transcript_6776/m.14977 type:complete len:145 (+) Transcript_6776:236-670(+)
MSFVGGKLKLKGGETLKPTSGGVKKKKKKDKDKEEGLALTIPEGQDGNEVLETVSPGGTTRAVIKDSKEDELRKALHGYELPEPSENEDRRTAAERKFEERVRKLEEERLRKLAGKSHRDRVKEFNEHLAKLSEHHDIPKVGPG